MSNQLVCFTGQRFWFLSVFWQIFWIIFELKTFSVILLEGLAVWVRLVTLVKYVLLNMWPYNYMIRFCKEYNHMILLYMCYYNKGSPELCKLPYYIEWRNSFMRHCFHFHSLVNNFSKISSEVILLFVSVFWVLLFLIKLGSFCYNSCIVHAKFVLLFYLFQHLFKNEKGFGLNFKESSSLFSVPAGRALQLSANATGFKFHKSVLAHVMHIPFWLFTSLSCFL